MNTIQISQQDYRSIVEKLKKITNIEPYYEPIEEVYEAIGMAKEILAILEKSNAPTTAPATRPGRLKNRNLSVDKKCEENLGSGPSTF